MEYHAVEVQARMESYLATPISSGLAVGAMLWTPHRTEVKVFF